MMKNDFDPSFDPNRNFTGVPMEAGDVSLDADWNASGEPEVQQANARIPPPHEPGREAAVLDDAIVSSADTPAVLREVLSILHPPEPPPAQGSAPADRASPGARVETVPAGTGSGKTLSPEMLAPTLIFPDLAEVVDKFVSETEESLRQMLDAVENPDSALLAGEDDDLFGRRSEDGGDG